MSHLASWIAHATGGVLNGPDVPVFGSVQTDSRECEEGSLYVARRGENADGHDFAAAAVERGAVCLIVERYLDMPISQILVPDATVALGDFAREHLKRLRDHGVIKVVGITGSAGKTTTKDLLGQVLGGFGRTVFPKLSFNNEVGCPLTVLRADERTEYLVLEMGASGPGHIRYLTSIAPLDVACVLMVGRAHLGGFGSEKAVADAKAELVEGLVPTGIAVLNADDDAVRAMSSVAGSKRIVWFSREQAKNGQENENGWTFDFRSESVTLHLVGPHQVMNGLAVLGILDALGLPIKDGAQLLSEAFPLSPHRMAVTRNVSFGIATNITVIDDSYNANPDSVHAGLLSAQAIAQGRLVAVLGEMLELGENGEEMHRKVAEEAAGVGVEVLVGVGDGTRAFEAEAENGLRFLWCKDASKATKLLEQELQAGDTVFVKGSFGSGVWAVADSLLGVDK